MAKLLVKNKATGATRPMTKASYDLIGHKRGYIAIGPYEEPKTEGEGKKPSPSDVVKAEMERLKAEQSDKNKQPEDHHDGLTLDVEDLPDLMPQKEKKKPGPKPKKQSDEV